MEACDVIACEAGALGLKGGGGGGGIERAPAAIRLYFRFFFRSEATKKSNWLVKTIVVN